VPQEGVWESGCIDPHFLDLGISWRWVVSFTPWPLYPWGKSLRYPLDNVEKRKFLTLPRLELRPLSRPAHSQSLYRLRYPGSNKGVMDYKLRSYTQCVLRLYSCIITTWKHIDILFYIICERNTRSLFWTLHTFNIGTICHLYSVQAIFRLHSCYLHVGVNCCNSNLNSVSRSSW
jgi:hypothetical protein